MTPGMLWLIIALILFIVEIFTPGFVVACLGFGALIAALVAYVHLSLFWQLLFGAVAAVLAFVVVRPFYKAFLLKSAPSVDTNIAGLMGKKALVVESIDPLSGSGRVKVGGEDWKAVSVDDTAIPAGTPVEIKGVDGVKLIVRSIQEETKA